MSTLNPTRTPRDRVYSRPDQYLDILGEALLARGRGGARGIYKIGKIANLFLSLLFFNIHCLSC